MKPSQAKSGELKVQYFVKTTALSVCLGIISCAALLSLFAAIMSQVDMPGPIVTVMAVVAICAGTLIFSYCMCRFLKKKPAFIGIICGLIVYLLIFFIGLFIPSAQMEPFNFAKFFAVILSGAIGAVWSVSRKRRK